MSADIGGDVDQNQPRPGADQAVGQAGKRELPEHQKLGDDIQKTRHHQRKQVNRKQLVAPGKTDAGKAVGGERRNKHRDHNGNDGIDHTVCQCRRENVHTENVPVRRKVQPRGEELRRIGQHIAELLKGVRDHKEERNGENQQRCDQNDPQNRLPEDLRCFFATELHFYPSCSTLSSLKTRLRMIVSATIVTAEIMPMAEASPNSN